MQLNLQLQTQALDIIIVTDIHLNMQILQRLATSIRTNGAHFDYCFVAGDIANCDHDNKTHEEQQMAQETRSCLSRLQDIVQCKVLWIPGNHDPLGTLNGEQHPNDAIINLHKRQYVLEVGLTVTALGGSIPAYTDRQFKSQEWSGYPYKSEGEFAKEVEAVFKEDEIKSSKIFLTHVGPSLSSTTIDRRRQPPVYAGSSSLDKLVDRQDMLILIHGHVHHGGKYDIIKNKPIINPGALLYGEYAVIKLARAQKIWKISKISFEKIV